MLSNSHIQYFLYQLLRGMKVSHIVHLVWGADDSTSTRQMSSIEISNRATCSSTRTVN